jgi:ribonuclease BN (tRNA processing enzyme)
MRVTLLGTGTAVPTPDRFPAGVLVEAGDETILIDAGPGVVRRLAAAGVSPDRVTTVLLTHYHPDHCADLVALLFALRNPHLAGRGPLRMRGAPGLLRLLDDLFTAWPRWLEPGDAYQLDAREIGPGSFGLDGVEVTASPVVHTVHSLAYRVREEGSDATVVVTGDVDEGEGVVDAARGADVLVCDAAFPDAHAQERHLTAADAGRAAAEAGVRLLCLTHFYPHEWKGHDPQGEAEAAFAGRVVVGHDLLRLELPGPDGEIVVRPAGSRS